jgi:hypothetical protein
MPIVMYARRPCGLMDKALIFGTKDCRFESCQGHSVLATRSSDDVVLIWPFELPSWPFRLMYVSLRPTWINYTAASVFQLMSTPSKGMSGVAQWLACWAHNPKVRGSKPRSAISSRSWATTATLFQEPVRVVGQSEKVNTTSPHACSDKLEILTWLFGLVV